MDRESSSSTGGQVADRCNWRGTHRRAIEQIREALREEFMKHLRKNDMNSQEIDRAKKAGRWGYTARGVVFAIMGLFLIFDGLQADPSQAQGLEGVLDSIAAKPFGQWMLALVAAGLACYGVHCFVEAKHRRVRL